MRPLYLLFACSAALCAQTLQINPNPVVMTAQANTAAATTVSFTSTGEAINFVVAVNPNTSWLHVTPSGQQVTPAMITVSTDPMPAGVYSSFLTVTTQGSVFNVPVTLNISVVGVSPSSLIFQYILGGSAPPA